MNQTKNTQSILALSSIALAALLTACGGGSSGGSTTPTDPVVKTCANGASDYPACKFFTANLQLTVPTPPFAIGSDELAAFNYLNDERAANGLGKLAYNEALTKAAKAHSDYMFLNKWLDHTETSGKQGFTGEAPANRAQAAGYPISGAVSEGLGLANSHKGAVQNLIDTVYHRRTIFDQSYTDVGLGQHCYGECKEPGIYYTFDYGYTKKQNNASDFVFSYPRDGQTGIAPVFCGESPWPLDTIITMQEACTVLKNPPDLTTLYDAKVGYPVSITIAKGKQLLVTKFEIYEAGASGSSIPLPVTVLTAANDSHRLLQAHEAFLIPRQSLKLNTVYSVSFAGTSDGVAFSKTWSFTTDTVQVRFN